MTKEQELFNKSSDSAALKSILLERVHQERKWGANNYHDNPTMWLAIISKQVGHLSHEILLNYESMGDDMSLRHEFVQVAACALAAIEEMDERGTDTADVAASDRLRYNEFIDAIEGKAMTKEEKIAIAKEALSEYPVDTIGMTALVRLADLGIQMEAGEVELSTEATITGKRYKCQLKVTWEEV